MAPEHFELTEYYQRDFRVNVVADEIQFNCQLEATARCAFRWAASSLEISIETVKVHKKHMYSKLGIKSRSELFSIFLQAQNA